VDSALAGSISVPCVGIGGGSKRHGAGRGGPDGHAQRARGETPAAPPCASLPAWFVVHRLCATSSKAAHCRAFLGPAFLLARGLSFVAHQRARARSPTRLCPVALISIDHPAHPQAPAALNPRAGCGCGVSPRAALRRQGGYWPPGPPSALFRCTCPHRTGGAYVNRPAFELG
jgi:hypothetical protein